MDELQEIEEIYQKALGELKEAYDSNLRYSGGYKNTALDNFQRIISIRKSLINFSLKLLWGIISL